MRKALVFLIVFLLFVIFTIFYFVSKFNSFPKLQSPSSMNALLGTPAPHLTPPPLTQKGRQSTGHKTKYIKTPVAKKLSNETAQNIVTATSTPFGYVGEPVINPTPEVNPLPAGAQALLPTGVHVSETKWVKFPGGKKELYITYFGKVQNAKELVWVVDVIGVKGGQYSLVFQKVIGNVGFNDIICRPNLKYPTRLLLLNQKSTSDLEGMLVIYRWDSSGVTQIYSLRNWGVHLDDINHDGRREIICVNRYGPDDILCYWNGKIIGANFEFPAHYRSVGQEMELSLSDPNIPSHEKLFKEEYGDWLPVYLYLGAYQEGLYVVHQLREIAKESTNLIDKKSLPLLEEKMKRFETEVKILQGNDQQKIQQLKSKVPFVVNNPNDEALVYEPPAGIYWKDASVSHYEKSDDPYGIFDANLSLMVDGKPETTIGVQLTIPSGKSVPLVFSGFTTQGLNVFANYGADLYKTYQYQPGGKYSFTTVTSIGTASASLTAAGGITYTQDGSRISWVSEGTNDFISIATGGLGAYNSPGGGDIDSPFIVPASAYPKPGKYFINMFCNNRTTQITGGKLAGEFYIEDNLQFFINR